MRKPLTAEAARAYQLLPGLVPGQCAFIRLPPDQPGQRMAYQAVNAVASRLFRPGNYRLQAVISGVKVCRRA